jgi:large subunit ribosomal protein L17
MRHLNKGRKFGRKRGPRRLFKQGLAANLILRGRMVTTEARAKEIRPIVEKLVTLGKKQNIASLRLLLSRLPKVAAHKVYHELAPKYQDRKGGFTRIIKQAKMRKHDAAKMATIEFI